MATIKTTYVIQSCPVCRRQLLRVAQGSTIIASPLLTCKGCGRTYRTDLCVEWDHHPHKWQVWAFPLFLPVLFFVLGAILEGMVLGVFAAIFGLIFGLAFGIKDLIRIIKSKKRMKNPVYIDELFKYGVITAAERDSYINNIK